jgi:hypothetical protein
MKLDGRNIPQWVIAIAAVVSLLITLDERSRIYWSVVVIVAAIVLLVIWVLTKQIYPKIRSKYPKAEIRLIHAGILAKCGGFIHGLVAKTVLLAILVLTISFVYSDYLPSALGEVLRSEGTAIAERTETCLLEALREGNEQVVTTLADSEEVRKVVYGKAMEKANDKGYVDVVAGCYVTSSSWLDEHRRLLTLSERRIITRYFNSKHSEEGLYSLIFHILSDEKMTAELKKEEAYNTEIYSEVAILPTSKRATIDVAAYDRIEQRGEYLVGLKQETVHLTSYDKIGIIGGYIGELGLRQALN